MEYAVVLSAARRQWQQRFRVPNLSEIKTKILQYSLKIYTFILNTFQNLKARKKIQFSKENSLLFFETKFTSINFAALYSRCKPPGSRRSLGSTMNNNSDGFQTCLVLSGRLNSSDFHSFFSTLRHSLKPAPEPNTRPLLRGGTGKPEVLAIRHIIKQVPLGGTF